MGRQLYLQRLAFGRSAFEAPEDVPPSGDWRNAEFSSHPELLVEHGFDGSSIQAYNARGRPFDERSEQLGKALREAQNDVLAAVGVVVRKDEQQSPPKIPVAPSSHWVPFFAVHHFGPFLLGSACCSWNEVILDRLLVYPYPSSVGLASLVSSVYHELGPWRFFLGKIPIHACSFVAYTCVRMLDDAIAPRALIHRLVIANVKSRSARKFFTKATPYFHVISDILANVARVILIGPLMIHSNLLTLGLVPPNRLIPPISAWNPFSLASSFSTIAWSQGILRSVTDFLRSPALLCTQRMVVWQTKRDALPARVINFVFWPLAHDPAHLCKFDAGPETTPKMFPRQRNFLSALYANPMRQLFKTFRWVFVSQNELDHLYEPGDAYFAYLAADYERLAAEHNITPQMSSNARWTQERVRLRFAHHNLQRVDSTVPNISFYANRDAFEASTLRSTTRAPPRQSGDTRTYIGLSNGEGFPLDRRPPLSTYCPGSKLRAGMLTAPLADVAARCVALPLGWLALRRIAVTFVGGPEYRWAAPTGARLPLPQALVEWRSLLSRTIFLLGTDLLIRISLWSIQAGLFVLWEKSKDKRKDDGREDVD